MCELTRQREQIGAVRSVPIDITLESKVVHAPENAPAVRPINSEFGHLGSFELVKPGSEAQGVNKRSKRFGKATHDRGGWSEGKQHGKQRRLAYEERHLRPPEQRRREPVTEHVALGLALRGQGAIDTIAELLRASHDEHGFSVAQRHQVRR